MMSNRLARQYRFGSLLKFSLPTIVMMVFMSLYTMADGVFVSRLIGTDALSAVNIVFPMVSVIIAVAIMLSTGASAIVARKMGEGGDAEARQDFTLVVVVGVALGLAITLLGLAFLEPLLRFLGATPATRGYCEPYARALLWFTVPAILQMLFQTFFVTAGRPGVGLAVTVLGGLANIVLDYAFIALLDWGILGAGLATGIGYSIPALSGLAWFAAGKSGTLRFARPVWRGDVLLKTFTNGASEMVINCSSAIVTYLFNISMLRYLGEDGVAAVTIVLYAEYLLVAVYLGYAGGVAPILSFNHGVGDGVQLRRLFRISLAFLAGCSAVTFAGALFFSRAIVGIFTSPDAAVFALAVHGFALYAAGFLFKGANIFASSMFTALSDGRTSALLSFLRSLVFIVLGMALLPRLIGVEGVWLAVPLAELLSVLVSAYYFRKQYRVWKNQRSDAPASADARRTEETSRQNPLPAAPAYAKKSA